MRKICYTILVKRIFTQGKGIFDMGKKIYRLDNGTLLGVCGGLGEFFNLDANIIRLVWAFSALLGGLGVFAYIVAALVLPKKSAVRWD